MTGGVPRWGCVVLTQGRRPDELRAALAALLAQRDVEMDVVVIGNGWPVSGLPDGVRGVSLPENLGIPGGRNAGVPHVRGELLFFLDDDARPADPSLLAGMARIFAREPDIGLIQPRAVDPDGRPAPRRWVPRLRVGDPARPSDVTALWEGAIAVRRELFERVGGWPTEFFYAHEGIDLAWAVWDAGARVRYAAELLVHHPAIDPTRHSQFHRLQARNRVFLARRRLPVPIAALYLANWSILTLARARSRAELTAWWRGTLEGFRGQAGPRRTISWRTVLRMARAGRPPLL